MTAQRVVIGQERRRAEVRWVGHNACLMQDVTEKKALGSSHVHQADHFLTYCDTCSIVYILYCLGSSNPGLYNIVSCSVIKDKGI